MNINYMEVPKYTFEPTNYEPHKTNLTKVESGQRLVLVREFYKSIKDKPLEWRKEHLLNLYNDYIKNRPKDALLISRIYHSNFFPNTTNDKRTHLINLSILIEGLTGWPSIIYTDPSGEMYLMLSVDVFKCNGGRKNISIDKANYRYELMKLRTDEYLKRINLNQGQNND